VRPYAGVTNLSISDDKKQINWDSGGNGITIICDRVHQAQLDEQQNLVIALLGINDTPSEMVIYNSNGSTNKTLSGPKDFYFSYLTKHPEIGTAVVCSTDSPIDDWYDWYFSIDFRRGALFRQGPSY